MEQTDNKGYVILICVVLVLVTLVGFEQVRHHKFVSYDDNTYVTENPHVTGGINSKSIGWAFTTSHGSNWHPLTWISHMVDCQLFGVNPGAHHIVNLLFHIANTLLLFWVFKKMTGEIWASGFVAAVFAIHPLHVESVAWIAERKDLLSTFFCILTIAAYIKYVRQPGTKKYLLVVLFFVLALLSKPMVVTLPFVLLLLDYWPLDRFKNIGRLIFEKIPLFVLSGILSFITFIVQQRTGAVSDIANVGFNLRVSNAMVSYIDYIVKMIWPVRLAILYPHPVDRLPLWQPMVCFILLIGITAGVLYLKRRYLTMGWLWYVGTLVPVIGLVQVGNQAMADRYTYLPLIGIFVMATWGAAEVLSKWRYKRILLGVLAAAIIITLTTCTREQVKVWQNSFTLYERALAVTKDNYKIHNNYGVCLGKKGESDEAVMHLSEALRIYPKFSEAHMNIGLAFLMQKKSDEAIKHCKEAIRTNPDWPEAYRCIGRAYAQQGKYDLAIQSYNDALRIRPNYPNVHYNMGQALARQDKYDEAIVYFKKVIETMPDWPGSYYSLGDIYYKLGQIELAIETTKKAIKLAETAGEKEMVERIQKRLRLYEADNL